MISGGGGHCLVSALVVLVVLRERVHLFLIGKDATTKKILTV